MSYWFKKNKDMRCRGSEGGHRNYKYNRARLNDDVYKDMTHISMRKCAAIIYHNDLCGYPLKYGHGSPINYIKHNVGKNVNNVFSKYVNDFKKVNKNIPVDYNNFWEQFIETYYHKPEFYIDSQNRIQKIKESPKKKGNHWWTTNILDFKDWPYEYNYNIRTYNKQVNYINTLNDNFSINTNVNHIYDEDEDFKNNYCHIGPYYIGDYYISIYDIVIKVPVYYVDAYSVKCHIIYTRSKKYYKEHSNLYNGFKLIYADMYRINSKDMYNRMKMLDEYIENPYIIGFGHCNEENQLDMSLPYIVKKYDVEKILYLKQFKNSNI